MSKKWQEVMIWAIVAIGLGAIVLGMYGVIAQPQRSTDGTELVAPATASDRAKGNENARVTLVEYSDLQCPACKYFSGIVKQLEIDKGDAVRVVFRHFPLQQHSYARPAALATEAAHVQGKFWEMHDILFARQEEWSKSTDIQRSLVGYATIIGLDISRFIADMQRPELGAKIDADRTAGEEQRIEGTPTFFLNGKLVQFRSYEELKKLVETELNK